MKDMPRKENNNEYCMFCKFADYNKKPGYLICKLDKKETEAIDCCLCYEQTELNVVVNFKKPEKLGR